MVLVFSYQISTVKYVYPLNHDQLKHKIELFSGASRKSYTTELGGNWASWRQAAMMAETKKNRTESVSKHRGWLILP